MLKEILIFLQQNLLLPRQPSLSFCYKMALTCWPCYFFRENLLYLLLWIPYRGQGQNLHKNKCWCNNTNGIYLGPQKNLYLNDLLKTFVHYHEQRELQCWLEEGDYIMMDDDRGEFTVRFHCFHFAVQVIPMTCWNAFKIMTSVWLFYVYYCRH